ncbi:right-handed parallel beta-helix repeat-containing protein [uncultured Rubinisphaera sp.]|uniref:right-handed parallel beta-helix repeat-containing protein n=1 Tax=uncultured Rubinisphaera sp. TaxID=1678686 RepID=UPI0030D87215|tara:strand:- start:60 stop:1352 length:1293 start_codon:yes stop_codon:yes gene_type:complete
MNALPGVILFCALTPQFLFANDYFVSTSGSNDNSGTLKEPWQTIQYASNQVKPGDTVHVRAGNYPEHVNLNVSGYSSKKVTIKAYEQEKVTLNPGSFYAFNLSYQRIQGFHILNTTGRRPGIEFAGNGGYVEIVGNEISDMKLQHTAAMRVGGTMHHFLISQNHVHHNNTGNEEGIRIHQRTHDFEVLNNEVNDNSNIGIDIVGWTQYGKPKRGLIRGNFAHDNGNQAPWSSGIYLDSPDDMIVEYNISRGQDFGFQFGCEPSDDESQGNILRFNLAYDNHQYGFGIGGYTGGEVHHCLIYNNVFVNNKREIGFSKNAGHHNVIVNNILYNSNGQSINTLSQPTSTLIDYNCYLTKFGGKPGIHSISKDPLFSNVLKKQFSLLQQSPCLTAGTTIRPLLSQIEGMSRFDNAISGESDTATIGMRKIPTFP